MLMRVALVFIIGLSACDRGANPANECDAVAAAMMQRDDAQRGSKAFIAKRCVEDQWNVELRRCLTKPAMDTWDCESRHMTEHQRETLDTALAKSFAGEPSTMTRNAYVMAIMRVFKDKMCRCKDAKCAQVVADEMTRWSQAESKRLPDPPRLTEDQQKQAAAIGEDMGRCMQTAMSAGATEPHEGVDGYTR
jgi:hypothetical protein